MKIVDLRKYDFYFGNVTKVNDEEFIFGHMNKECGNVYLNFYKYDLIKDSIIKLNKYGIPMYDFATTLSTIVEDGYIYTNVLGISNYYDFYKMSIQDGTVEKLYSFDKSGIINMLNSRYVLAYGEDYKDDEEMYESIYEEDGILYLIDLIERKTYVIKDNVIRLEDGGYFKVYKYNNEEWIVFETDQNINDNSVKLHIHKDGYGVSLMRISVNQLVEDVKNNEESLKVTPIMECTENIGVRFLEMDNDNIYFKATDFKNNIEKIYEIGKEKFHINKIKEYDFEVDKEGRKYTVYDINSKQLICKKLKGENVFYCEKSNKEVASKWEKEEFIKIIDNNMILESVYEDKIRVINLEDLSEKEYENSYEIIGNNLILFEII
ncbi:hypothetical protein [Clostridium sp. ATCC 25772]|uniref:hypothetical protein n=1 Tax=Clostridium sp. ATCC 25772 TaxID=1676991 RepID=UPI0007803AAB|nr:hypothetical protein [Clostridium sp. ATCC 25772]